MDKLGIGEGSVVADLGIGGGWFTVRLARRVGPNGRVWAEDIQPQMMEATRRRVEREGLADRVRYSLGTASDPRLPPDSVDAALMVNAYGEVEQPVTLLRNIAGALKPDGRLAIVDFTKEGGGPGPAMDDRVDPERIIREAEAAGLRLIEHPDFLRYQYMLVFERNEPTTR